MSNKSNILFYSPDCEYSRQVIQLIDVFRIRDQFVIININIDEYQLPTFVDRVPLIFITGQNQLVVDDEIPSYLDTLKGVPSQQQQQQQATASSASSAPVDTMLSMSDMNRGISDSFSFINDTEHLTPGSFVFLGDDGPNNNTNNNNTNNNNTNNNNTNNNNNNNNSPIPAPQDTSKSNKFDSQEFERYTSMRDMDLAAFKKQNPPR